ncbi:MAG TPA: hypothetical protein VKV39_13220 [Candidatus Sulfotelmatobacter sp.]|nr:hypothetical protein [Candidatus Sulfotelmatobacter sp.]
MKHSSGLVRSIVILVLLAGMFPCLSRAANSCQPVFEAMTKIVSTPSHSYTTHTGASANGGRPADSETIYVDGKAYMRVRGKWMQSPATPQEVLDQLKENRDQGKNNCQILRSELIGVEPVTVYSVHSETENFKEDSQIWISNVTGKVLKEEQDVDMGGTIGKEHRSARFEYSNIRPPM